jgi:hypothetical protein
MPILSESETLEGGLGLSDNLKLSHNPRPSPNSLGWSVQDDIMILALSPSPASGPSDFPPSQYFDLK